MLRWLVRLVVAVALAVGVLAFLSRFSDGPLVGPLPGGALITGEEVTLPVRDWSFVADVDEIQLQLDAQDTSRTTWILWIDGQPYVPVSLGFPPGKSWHLAAAEDGRATLRIEGKRYPVQLSKLDDGAVEQMAGKIRAEVERKYGSAPPGDSGVWLFLVSSRAPGS